MLFSKLLVVVSNAKKAAECHSDGGRDMTSSGEPTVASDGQQNA